MPAIGPRQWGHRDYAVLMVLAKLGLRASEVAALSLDDIDWRSGQDPCPWQGPATIDGAATPRRRHGYRRLHPAWATSFTVPPPVVRTLAPHVGFASGCAITMIAKQALERAGIHGYAHHGAHLFRHSLATDLLRGPADAREGLGA